MTDLEAAERLATVRERLAAKYGMTVLAMRALVAEREAADRRERGNSKWARRD